MWVSYVGLPTFFLEVCLFTVIVGEKYCLLHGEDDATEVSSAYLLQEQMKGLGWKEQEGFEVSLLNTRFTQTQVRNMVDQFKMTYQKGMLVPVTLVKPKRRRKPTPQKKVSVTPLREPKIRFGRAGGSYNNLGESLNRVIRHIDEHTPTLEEFIEQDLRLVSLSAQWGRGTTKTCLKSLWREFWGVAGRNVVHSDRYAEIITREALYEPLVKIKTVEDIYSLATPEIGCSELFKIYALRHIAGHPHKLED